MLNDAFHRMMMQLVTLYIVCFVLSVHGNETYESTRIKVPQAHHEGSTLHSFPSNLFISKTVQHEIPKTGNELTVEQFVNHFRHSNDGSRSRQKPTLELFSVSQRKQHFTFTKEMPRYTARLDNSTVKDKVYINRTVNYEMGTRPLSSTSSISTGTSYFPPKNKTINTYHADISRRIVSSSTTLPTPQRVYTEKRTLATKLTTHLRQMSHQTPYSSKTPNQYTNTKTSKIPSVSPKTTTIKKQVRTKGHKKDFTTSDYTRTTKLKHIPKRSKPVSTSFVLLSSAIVHPQGTSNNEVSRAHWTQKHIQSTDVTRLESSTSSMVNSETTPTTRSPQNSETTPTTRSPQNFTTQYIAQTNSTPYFETTSDKQKGDVFPSTSKKQHHGKTRILINEIVISQQKPDEQFIELKVSSDYTHDLQSYEVVVFSGRGEVLSTMDIHGNTGNPYNILANEDIHVNIRKELQQKKSLAVAVYDRSNSAVSDITMKSEGVMDAIVLTAYDGKPSDQLMQSLMNDNVTPFHVSLSALEHGGSISRCKEKHVRDTQDFMELSRPKATRGFRNSKCPKNNFPTTSSNSFDNVKLTITVVMSCLALFLVIVLLVVMNMKQKQRKIKLLQSTLWLKEDDDEEDILNMESVKFEESHEDPTFKNDVYLTIQP